MGSAPPVLSVLAGGGGGGAGTPRGLAMYRRSRRARTPDVESASPPKLTVSVAPPTATAPTCQSSPPACDE